VLSNLIDVRAAAGWRAESSIAALDTGRPCGFGATLLRGTVLGGTVLGGINALGVARSRAAQGPLMPGQTSLSSRQDTRKKYQHATRVAALGGSATGSHPVSWDPV
jgi:hypothetical protein